MAAGVAGEEREPRKDVVFLPDTHTQRSSDSLQMPWVFVMDPLTSSSPGQLQGGPRAGAKANPSEALAFLPLPRSPYEAARLLGVNAAALVSLVLSPVFFVHIFSFRSWLPTTGQPGPSLI